MLTFWDKIVAYLQDKQNLRKVIITGAAVFLLLGVVLFSSDIQKLLNLPWPSRAEGPPGPPGSDLTWESIGLPNLITPRSNAKLIDVVDAAGERWLYAIGGIDQVSDGTGGKRINLVNKVERIKIDNNPDPTNSEIGKPVGTWQSAPDMNFGHAEFGLVAYQDYIAVIAGDIHAPKIGTDSTDIIRTKVHPLIYSTIEILNYKDPAPTWQVYALLTGVNFYPEVTLIGDKLNIVGGVYGNPFGTEERGNLNVFVDYYTGLYPFPDNLTAKDPLRLEADFFAWESLNLASKKVVGGSSVPLTSYRGGIGDYINDPDNPDPGEPSSPPGGWNEDAFPSWFTFSGNNNIAFVFSQELLNGRFYTTVSEHYILDLTKNPLLDDSFVVQIGELGMDYTGTIDPFTWTRNKVLSLGHLRLYAYAGYIDTRGNTEYSVTFVSPVPQGRYGHKLIINDGYLLVLGGASWSTPYRTVRRWDKYDPLCHEMCLPIEYVDTDTRSHFWVIDDAIDPFTDNSHWYNFLDYQYVGNITYMWHPILRRWDSTNADMAGFSADRKLPSSYAFQLPDLKGGGKKGRAFFGLAELDFSETVPPSNNYRAAVAVGGLQNDLDAQYPQDYFWNYYPDDPDCNPCVYSHFFGIPVEVTNRTEKLEDLNIGWVDQEDIDASVLDKDLSSPPGSENVGDRYIVWPTGLSGWSGHDNDIATVDSIEPTVWSFEDPLEGWATYVVDEKAVYIFNGVEWVLTGFGRKEGSYNLFSIGIDRYRSISFDGQLKFQDETDPVFRIISPVHVPNYYRTGPTLSDKTTSMFAGDSWYSMPNGMNLFTFSAVKDVRVVDTNGKTTVYIYKVGGVEKPDTYFPRMWMPIVVAAAQYLGPFTYGQPGVPDIGESTFTVDPPIVKADGVSYATATLTLLDYYRAPVVGTKAVVATDANSSWPPVSTDNIKIRPLVTDPPQVAPSGWPTPWLVTDSTGTVQFKLTSLKEIPLDQVCAYISTDTTPPTTKPAPFITPCQPITFTLVGAVSDLNSTVEADPIKVAATGEPGDYSTVTVTLLDHQDPPQPVTGDYYVKILSSRNIRDINQPSDPDGDTDKIKIIDQKTDSEGKATFEVRSSVRGEAIIYARYSLTIPGLEDPDSYISLTDTATITFGALISSLEPDHGLQGQLLPNITATGAATHWDNTTTVELIPPSQLSFYWVNNDSGQGNQLKSNIDDLYLNADRGRTIVELGIWSQANPRTTVTFNILDNADGTKGNFWPGGEKDQISGITDSYGQATFSYQSGSIAGIVKIRATIGGISDEAWLILHDARPNPYLLKIIADPTILDGTIRDSAIRTALYRYVGNQAPELITDPLIFHFVSDSNGTFSDETVTSTGGIAATAYTRSTSNGRVRIFTWVEGYGAEGLFLANKVVIYQKGGTSQISFTLPPAVTDNFKLRIDDVNISETADLGFWTFRAITPMGGEDAEIVDYPFQVLPYDWNITAKLTAIDPKIGLRGPNNLQVAITGQNTHFYKGTTGSSVVTFTPSPSPFNTCNPCSAEGIEVLNSTLVVVSDTSLTITINIKHDADVGFWNVQVATGSEIATLAGNTDFLVADDSRGYFINLWAAPDLLARDGLSTSTIDAWVGQVDPLTGRIRLINNVTVNFAKNDNGKLSANSAVTNSDGKATIRYTTDAGETNEIVTITGWASPEAGVLIAQWTDIYKEVYVFHYLLTADPTELSLLWETAVSDLSITGLPGNRIPITLYFNGSPKGHLEPVSTTSNIKGEATSQYIAAPKNERIQEVVRIYALATIPGFGQVRSNIVDIQIGRESSKYTLELSAVPDSVIAGGTLRSTVTAVLKWQNQPEPQSEIKFMLDAAGTGDYLTDSSVSTNTSGVAVTHFVPGNVVGAVIVKATPPPIPLFRQVIINKTADGYPDEDLSTISAVPSRCLLPDGVAFSVVTITLRNSNYVPIANRQVRLSTDRSADTIKLADGTTATSTNTNSQGKAIFHISSTAVGTSNVTAKFDADFDLTTDIIFEALGVCIPQKLDLTVPFELRDYDNLVLVYVTENGLTNGDFVNEVYTKSARPLNKIDELKNIMLYLHPNERYTVWVKGRYHLAKTKPFTTGSIGGNDPIPLIFDELLIADIRPDRSDLYGVLSPFQDNAVNAIDYWLIWKSWFNDSYLADFTLDGQVNSLDFSYWLKNIGRGALGGPPPLYDK